LVLPCCGLNLLRVLWMDGNWFGGFMNWILLSKINRVLLVLPLVCWLLTLICCWSNSYMFFDRAGRDIGQVGNRWWCHHLILLINFWNFAGLDFVYFCCYHFSFISNNFLRDRLTLHQAITPFFLGIGSTFHPLVHAELFVPPCLILHWRTTGEGANDFVVAVSTAGFINYFRLVYLC